MTRQSRPVPVERRRIAPRPVCVVVVYKHPGSLGERYSK